MAGVTVLVTNDDGIDAPGLHALARRLADIADVVVVAPFAEASGSGAAVGPFDAADVHVHDAAVPGLSIPAYAVEGPPALGVLLARLGAFGSPPDIVVSGINMGANPGGAVHHSGTVGAALTAFVGGISGIAVSLDMPGEEAFGHLEPGAPAPERFHWGTAAELAAWLTADLLARPAPPRLANLNVPNRPLAAVHGVRSARLASMPGWVAAEVSLEPAGPGLRRAKLRWEGSGAVHHADTDAGALDAGYAALTWLVPISATDPQDGAAAALDARLRELGTEAVRFASG